MTPILASLRLRWWCRGEAGQQCFSERWLRQDRARNGFRVCTLCGGCLGSSQSGYHPHRVYKPCKYQTESQLLVFLKQWKVVLN